MMGLVSLSLFFFFLKGNLESSWKEWLGLVFPAKWKNRFAKKMLNFSFFREIMQNFGIWLVGEKGLQINLHLVSAILNLFLSLAMIKQITKRQCLRN